MDERSERFSGNENRPGSEFGSVFEDAETVKTAAVDPALAEWIDAGNSQPAQPNPVLWSPNSHGVNADDARHADEPAPAHGAPPSSTVSTLASEWAVPFFSDPPSPAPDGVHASPPPVANTTQAPDLTQAETVATPVVGDVARLETVATPSVPAGSAAPSAPSSQPDVATLRTMPTLPPMPEVPAGHATEPTAARAGVAIALAPAPSPSAPSTTLPPASSLPAPATTRPRRKTSPLWWVLIAALALAATGSWGAYAAYRVPANFVSGPVCAAFTHASKQGLYNTLSPRLRATIPADEFTSVLNAATSGSQAIQRCARQGAYDYALGRPTAIAGIVLTRANGQRVTGTVDLAHSGGAWWIDDISPSLLGVDVGALAAANAYCAASTAQNIPALYDLEASALQQSVSLADFTTAAQLHQRIDGKVTHCAVMGLVPADASGLTTFKVNVTWATLGQRTGTVAFAKLNGVWKITAVDPSVRGSDLGAFAAAQRFCVDIASGAYQDVYDLFSTAFRGQADTSAFAALLSGSKTGLKYAGCQLDTKTFTVSGTNASIQGQLSVQVISSKQTLTTPLTLRFVLEQGAWRLANLG